jgi:phytoene dehydrogenase-like protein
MKRKSIIIIGAGIAGLAAGCYAQMNGYDSQIFELHDLPGGLCTAWERKEYIFDGCIHYLFGSGAGQPFNSVWQELGVLNNRVLVNHEELMRVTDPDGATLIVYSDPDRLEDHLKGISPDDAELIDDFTAGIRLFRDFDMTLLQQKPKDLMSAQEWGELGIKMLPYVPAMARWALLSAEELGQKFKNPFLRRAIPQIFAWTDIPVMVGMSLLAYMDRQNAGFPMGGSLEFARAIEKRYLDLGGQIHYKSQVEKILVKNHQAVGVRLYNNHEQFADYIVSAADGHGTIFDLLDGDYVDRQIKEFYNYSLPTHSIILVSFGVNRDLTDQPHWVTYLLNDPIFIAGENRYEIGVKHYCFDRGLAPIGKSSVEIMLPGDFSYWQRIYGRKLYDTEQIEVSNQAIEQLSQIYPGISGQVEVTDIATPLSFERYTGNWLGSTCGWLLTKKTMQLMIQGMKKTLPKLKNFYMAGQWVEPGGSLPIVAMSGRNAIQLICHADHKEFETTIL